MRITGNGRDLFGISRQFQRTPKDWPGWRASGNFLEASFAKSRSQPRENEHVGLLAAWLDGIAFEQARAVTLREFGRSFEQLNRDAASAVAMRDKETGNRPDWLVVHRLEHSRAGKSHVTRARCNRAPAYRLTICVSEQTRCLIGPDEKAHGFPIAFTFLSTPFCRWQPPPHAPATGTRAVLAEEFFKIPPA